MLVVSLLAGLLFPPLFAASIVAGIVALLCAIFAPLTAMGPRRNNATEAAKGAQLRAPALRAGNDATPRRGQPPA